jgi:glutamate-1-semialdehyde 2,1-aminomutase
MSAIRLARGATGRDKILKFEGCYHGHSDSLLAAGAGSGLATLGIPSSPGVTEGAARDTLTSPFNDLGAARAIFAEWGRDIAVVIVEPVAANMGVVPPDPGFLEGLRELCDHHAALLLFDEVITGFRMSLGGAQQVFGIRPDLSTFGKVMGGGFPCAAFGGRADLMSQLAPTGPIYQAGTLSGNPVAVAAGSATLALAAMLDPYPRLEQTALTLTEGLEERFLRNDIPTTINRSTSLFSIFFTDGQVRDFQDAKKADHDRYARFFHHMLASGVYLPPSGYELWTLSAVLTEDHVNTVLDAAATFAG